MTMDEIRRVLSDEALRWLVEVCYSNAPDQWSPVGGRMSEQEATAKYDEIKYTMDGGKARLVEITSRICREKVLVKPPLPPPQPDPNGLDPAKFGHHQFPGVVSAEEGRSFFTSDCAYECGAWMGGTRSGGPDGGDDLHGAHGLCPKNPLPQANAVLGLAPPPAEGGTA